MNYHNITVDDMLNGDGLRTVLWVAGCDHRCPGCQNPETWSENSGIPFDEAAKAELFEALSRDYMTGVTFSGGEPLLQMEFVTEVFRLLKKDGINTCIDTAGQPFRPGDEEWLKKFDALLDVTDLFIVDIKTFSDRAHRELTGHGNANILEMLRYLSAKRKRMWIRHVLVPGVTDDEQELIQIREFIATLHRVRRVEILPYHTMGIGKWEKLGLKYPLEGVPMPTAEEVKRAEILIGAFAGRI